MATSPQEAHEQAKERQIQGAMAQGAAAEQGREQISFADAKENSGLIDELFSPGINPDPEQMPDDMDAADLEAALSAEFGRHLGLGNISRSDWHDEKDMNRAYSLLQLQEYRRPGGLGSECTGAVRRIMTGEDREPSELTPFTQRQIRRSYDERTFLQSLSINARGWRGVTEFIGVNINRSSSDAGEENGGLFSSIRNKLP